jgi:hypothetical protein
LYDPESEELHSYVMIIVWEHDHIGPHVAHNNRKLLEQDINSLTGEMSEFLVLSS